VKRDGTAGVLRRGWRSAKPTGKAKAKAKRAAFSNYEDEHRNRKDARRHAQREGGREEPNHCGSRAL
jgi:hypothetical protein